MRNRWFIIALILSLGIISFTSCSPKGINVTSEKSNSSPTKSSTISSTNVNANISSNNSSDSQVNSGTEVKIEEPDDIIYYKKGTQIHITKDNPSYEKIIQLTNTRVISIKSMYKSTIPKSDIDNLKSKGYLLEFDYSNMHDFNYKNDSNDEFKVIYKKLYFPLETVDNKDYTTFMINIGDKEGTVGSSSD